MENRKLIIILGLVIVSAFVAYKLLFNEHRTKQQIEDDNKIESGNFDMEDLEEMDFGF